jgi:putative Ca2+/H+ antiporter (TMEM165/GDT1 family)
MLNHLLAVMIGTFMTIPVPLSWIQIAESLPQILLAANLVLGDNHRFWRTPGTPYY